MPTYVKMILAAKGGAENDLLWRKAHVCWSVCLCANRLKIQEKLVVTEVKVALSDFEHRKFSKKNENTRKEPYDKQISDANASLSKKIW